MKIFRHPHRTSFVHLIIILKISSGSRVVPIAQTKPITQDNEAKHRPCGFFYFGFSKWERQCFSAIVEIWISVVGFKGQAVSD
jgi:hypothetical protein